MSNELSKEVLEFLQETAQRVPYGNIQINLSETGDSHEVVVTERVRFRKASPPKPGQLRSVIRKDET